MSLIATPLHLLTSEEIGRRQEWQSHSFRKIEQKTKTLGEFQGFDESFAYRFW